MAARGFGFRLTVFLTGSWIARLVVVAEVAPQPLIATAVSATINHRARIRARA